MDTYPYGMATLVAKKYSEKQRKNLKVNLSQEEFDRFVELSAPLKRITAGTRLVEWWMRQDVLMRKECLGILEDELREEAFRRSLGLPKLDEGEGQVDPQTLLEEGGDDEQHRRDAPRSS